MCDKVISRWDKDFKVSDEFLSPIFEEFYRKLHLPNIMAKKNFHELAHLVPVEKIDAEIRVKLNAIVKVAHSAKPATE